MTVNLPVRIGRVLGITSLCMAIANTAPPYADILDAVVILGGKKSFFVFFLLCVYIAHERLHRSNLDSNTHPPGDGWVTQSFAHEVSQQGVGPEKAQSDVGGFGEIPQDG